MALKIRLRQQGRRNCKMYRLVITDCRSPRDGKYIESIGWYNPTATAEDLQLHVKAERAQHWIAQGAELSEKAEALIAKAAPQIIKELKEKQLSHKAKMLEKRKARKKSAAA